MNSTTNIKNSALTFTIVSLMLFSGVLIFPSTRAIFIEYSSQCPYLMGFIKFSVLSTVGDIIGIKLRTKVWNLPKGGLYKGIIWGFLGMAITLMFKVFAGGVTLGMETGYLPFHGSQIAFAFFVSSIMNLTFAPTMMAFHRITDTMIDFKIDGNKNTDLVTVVKSIDWSSFVNFVLCKTVPLFWIPAHTMTFLLPEEFRVVLAASLSIALGVILALSTKNK